MAGLHEVVSNEKTKAASEKRQASWEASGLGDT